MFAKPVPEKSDGQVLAALSTAAGQSLSAVLGGHSLSEAVLHLCVPLLRLESSFHLAFTPFLKIKLVLILLMLCTA